MARLSQHASEYAVILRPELLPVRSAQLKMRRVALWSSLFLVESCSHGRAALLVRITGARLMRTPSKTRAPVCNQEAIILGLLAFFMALVVLSFFGSVLLNIVDAVFVCYALDRDTQTVSHPEVHEVFSQVRVMQDFRV